MRGLMLIAASKAWAQAEAARVKPRLVVGRARSSRVLWLGFELGI